MRKRVLSFLLAASAAFCFICSSAPEAQAIVPIGFVQSALASYVSSTGYKLYNDNGTGQDILGSLGELYDDYVTVSNKTITGQFANLAFLANSSYIYQDNSGQIVVSKVAADIFQDFADWIQTEYSVTVGSETPTEVVSASGSFYIASSGAYIYSFSTSDGPVSASGTNLYYSSPVGSYYRRNVWTPVYLATPNASSGFISVKSPVGGRYSLFSLGFSSASLIYQDTDGSGWRIFGTFNAGSPWSLLYLGESSFTFDNIVVTDYEPVGSSPSDWTAGGTGVSGLAVTLAQAVADVVGQAKEDDAVVIGVGASAGATAQDIANMVAQGVKAQTLDPSVSITAEAVIDTPVQPYPDIDGLGLPTLGAALVDRFPFCIPWDFVDTVRLLSADPQPINIKVDLIPQRIKTSVGITSDTSFDIDFSGEQYAKIGVFCRWGSLITFCFGLFLLTKRLVWTA